MTYDVKTAVFEGPFDLLIDLVNRRYVDVTQVSITGIIDDYLESIRSESPELDVASGFVLMACILIHLKARFLLPDPEEIDLEEELALLDERDRLLARMLSHLTFQDVGGVLEHRLKRAARFVSRSVGIDREIGGPPVPSLPPDVTPVTLARLAAGVMAPDPPDPDLDVDHLDLDLPSVADAIDEIRLRITAEMESTFEQLVAHCTRRVEVAAYFLAMLELARWGVLSVAQDHPRRISVRHASGGPTGAADGYGMEP